MVKNAVMEPASWIWEGYQLSRFQTADSRGAPDSTPHGLLFLQRVGQVALRILPIQAGRRGSIWDGVRLVFQQILGEELHLLFESDSGDQRLQVFERPHVFDSFIFITDVGLFVARLVLRAGKFQSANGQAEGIDAFEFRRRTSGTGG